MRILKLTAFLFFVYVFHNLALGCVFAKGEFSTSYGIVYDVDSSGITNVTEDIKLKNQTEKYYPSSFSLTIGATKLSDVSASDSQGSLPVVVSNQGKKSQITVKFENQQIVGMGKEYSWKLKFSSKDFAQSQGKIWQVSVPKMSTTEDVDSYELILSVPVSFGDPTTILPDPKSTKESGGKLQLSFSKDQLSESGILANFGSDQLFDYSMTFHLSNNSVLPAIAKLPLPPDTRYQQVTVDSIDPKPETVELDSDGNSLAFFNVPQKKSLDVKVNGLAKLYVKPYKPSPPLTSQEIKNYTQSQKFWEKDTPQIKQKLQEIFGNQDPKTNFLKAKLINRYVANFLIYDEDRIKQGDFQRLGSLTSLSNPEKSLCQEFTDLFITLARAAGVPARQLTGYAYSSNSDIRPSSLDGTILHTWPEYYDSELGWVMIDPTWENTTGGVDYFSKFDLNHFVLAVRGESSTEPVPADTVDIKFSDLEFKPKSDIKVYIDSDSEIFAGLGSSLNVVIENSGNSEYPQTGFVLNASNIEFSTKTQTPVRNISFDIPGIPPFGKVEYNYVLKTGQIWKSYNDVITLKVGDKSITKQISVKPFFASRYFAGLVLTIIALIALVYSLSLATHVKTQKNRGK